ncbi:rCG35493, isoform CRA_a [Rattus norvegicus]|uniref:RCG35493, isoform CRA_a n=1 Tax=Rattus norvegicus TaxID=10116 RepID=A6HIF0_RAT|nr:rCG35493, isoform CRA_a [Rattus norvegicus]
MHPHSPGQWQEAAAAVRPGVPVRPRLGESRLPSADTQWWLGFESRDSLIVAPEQNVKFRLPGRSN